MHVKRKKEKKKVESKKKVKKKFTENVWKTNKENGGSGKVKERKEKTSEYLCRKTKNKEESGK